MKRYVALLRGINVGGRVKIPMERLRRLFVDLGHTDARTYIQSGNVIFTGPSKSAGLREGLEEAIAAGFGLDVSVLLRTGAELDEVLAGNPFLRRKADPSTLHVVFLDSKPARSRVEGIDAGRFAPDEFVVAGREIYVSYPNGMGRSKLSHALFERQLGRTATARSWKTVTKLAELAKA